MFSFAYKLAVLVLQNLVYLKSIAVSDAIAVATFKARAV